MDNRRKFDFCLSDYRLILGELRGLGYESRSLGSLQAAQRDVFLRHDVDMCLDRALRVAEVEAEVHFTATYYVLISTDMYNPASAINRSRLRSIVALGHSIGLHFDATKYADDRASLEIAAEDECDLLSMIIDAPVESISFHRPAGALFNVEGQFAGRLHTYEPALMRNVAYVSDSSGGFFQGHPLDHPAIAAGRALQLLTHPIWWYADHETRPHEALAILRSEHHGRLERTLEAAVAKAATRGR